MAESTIRATILRVLGEVAPEADLATIDPSADLREDLELDSMDILNFAIGLAEATGVEVPESDYPRIVTIDGAVAYIESVSTSAPNGPTGW